MKKQFLILSLLIMAGVYGCKPGNYKGVKPIFQSGGIDFQEITIDGCQYLQNTYSAGSPLTHKGNCNNPIHKK